MERRSGRREKGDREKKKGEGEGERRQETGERERGKEGEGEKGNERNSRVIPLGDFHLMVDKEDLAIQGPAFFPAVWKGSKLREGGLKSMPRMKREKRKEKREKRKRGKKEERLTSEGMMLFLGTSWGDAKIGDSAIDSSSMEA
jgi:hypothetical protein